MTPAWTLGAWPGVLWQPGRDPRPHFVHLATHVGPRVACSWPRMGQTVWEKFYDAFGFKRNGQVSENGKVIASLHVASEEKSEDLTMHPLDETQA